jgi:hypothetical protein
VETVLYPSSKVISTGFSGNGPLLFIYLKSSLTEIALNPFFFKCENWSVSFSIDMEKGSCISWLLISWYISTGKLIGFSAFIILSGIVKGI